MPTKKMKPFHWTKLRAGPVVQNSFFAEVKRMACLLKQNLLIDNLFILFYFFSPFSFVASANVSKLVDISELENLFSLVEKPKVEEVVAEKPSVYLIEILRD